jgi:uncharacterized protein (TIGR00369 family)
MKDPDASRADLQQAGWKQRPLAGFIQSAGPLWTRRQGDGWQYGILTSAEHANPAGVVHGGLISTLMDHALSAIGWQAAGRRPCVTVQLDTQFLAPVVPGAFLKATGRVVRATGSLLFMQGELSVDDNAVASGSAVLKILRSDSGSPARSG